VSPTANIGRQRKLPLRLVDKIEVAHDRDVLGNQKEIEISRRVPATTLSRP
jgi:hypothetical protein